MFDRIFPQIFSRYPEVGVKALGENGPASYGRRGVFGRMIAFGNWKNKENYDDMSLLSDDELVQLCLTEETLHWILDRTEGIPTSVAFDNLTFELRRALQS